MFLLLVVVICLATIKVNSVTFNKVCKSDDYCLASSPSKKLFCQSRESNLIDTLNHTCIFKPHKNPGVQHYNSRSHWDCEYNSWKGNFFENKHFQNTNLTFITYGDSLSRNIFNGLYLLQTNYELVKWNHQLQIVKDESIHNLEHVCCRLCSCGNSLSTNFRQIKKTLKNNKGPVIFIVRASIHTTDAYAMAKELNALKANFPDVFIVYLKHQGNGFKKPKKFLLTQNTQYLKAYDEKILSLFQPTIVTNLAFEIFQKAEEDCDARFASLDGTHMSPSVEVAVANELINLIHQELKFRTLDVSTHN